MPINDNINFMCRFRRCHGVGDTGVSHIVDAVLQNPKCILHRIRYAMIMN